MGGIINIVVFSAIFALLAWFYALDDAYCVVHDSVIPEVNGYYLFYNNMYYLTGYNQTRYVDIFGLYNLRRQTHFSPVIFFRDNYWTLNFKDNFYKNPTGDISSSTHSWKSLSDNSNVFVTCSGHAALVTGNKSPTNLQLLMLHPMTSILLAIITYVAFYLWENRIEVSSVAFSYNSFIVEKQYWRAMTASFSHFDLMHFAFNTMTLYQFGILEVIYGSLTYAYLSIALVFITILICSGVTYWMATHYGRTDLLSQLSVGYSCVLFAWMVAASVRMPKFCPVVFLPTLCFDTWSVPLPFSNYVRVNIGPIVLLFITKLIIPRSSFVGHLSGVVVGYPLAWNWLNGFIPPIYCTLMILFVCYSADKAATVEAFNLVSNTSKLIYNCTPGYHAATSTVIATVSNENTDHHNQRMRVLNVLLLVVLVSYVFLCVQMMEPISQLFFRVITMMLLLNTCVHLQDTSDTGTNTTHHELILFAPLFLFAIAVVYDSCNMMSYVAARILLSENIHNALVSQGMAIMVFLWLVLVEAVICLLLIRALQEEPHCLSLLRQLQVDPDKFDHDLTVLKLDSVLNATGILPSRVTTARVYFSGVGHRLQHTPIELSTNRSSDASERQTLLERNHAGPLETGRNAGNNINADCKI